MGGGLSHDSLLYRAARSGDVDMVRAAIKNGANPNQSESDDVPDKLGQSPLDIAQKRGNGLREELEHMHDEVVEGLHLTLSPKSPVKGRDPAKGRIAQGVTPVKLKPPPKPAKKETPREPTPPPEGTPSRRSSRVEETDPDPEPKPMPEPEPEPELEPEDDGWAVAAGTAEGGDDAPISEATGSAKPTPRTVEDGNATVRTGATDTEEEDVPNVEALADEHMAQAQAPEEEAADDEEAAEADAEAAEEGAAADDAVAEKPAEEEEKPAEEEEEKTAEEAAVEEEAAGADAEVAAAVADDAVAEKPAEDEAAAVEEEAAAEEATGAPAEEPQEEPAA